jgi:hypothetical protein
MKLRCLIGFHCVHAFYPLESRYVPKRGCSINKKVEFKLFCCLCGKILWF